MAHLAQYEYVSKVRDKFPDHFKNCKVVDCGSCDINGNNRWAFQNFKYLGIDVGAGPNVDVVSPIHKVLLGEPVDVVISTECLEHDMHYKESIQAMYNMLKPGGFLLITCATTGRAEHGTLRTSPGCSNTSQLSGEWSNYYKNLTEKDFRECLDFDKSFSKYEFEVNTESCDIYFWGIKSDNIFKESEPPTLLNKLFSEIGRTDKHTAHHYGFFYGPLLEHKKETAKYVLEVGTAAFGGGDLEAFGKFFPNAEIHGIDINQCGATGKNIKNHIGNGYDKNFLAQFEHIKWDVVLDDGPHDPVTQTIFLNYFHTRLAPGGVLLIEDVYESSVQYILNNFTGDKRRLSVINRMHTVTPDQAGHTCKNEIILLYM